jgi:hypothetical protein
MMIAGRHRANHVDRHAERPVNVGFPSSDSLCRHAARPPPARGAATMYMTGVSTPAPRE